MVFVDRGRKTMYLIWATIAHSCTTDCVPLNQSSRSLFRLGTRLLACKQSSIGSPFPHFAPQTGIKYKHVHDNKLYMSNTTHIIKVTLQRGLKCILGCHQ